MQQHILFIIFQFYPLSQTIIYMPNSCKIADLKIIIFFFIRTFFFITDKN